MSEKKFYLRGLIRWASVAILLTLLLVGLLYRGPQLRAGYYYQKGLAAAENGDWPNAFLSFWTVYELVPEYKDVRQHLDQSLAETLPRIPEGVNLRTEIQIIRWLSNGSEFEELVQVLERCMVVIPAGEFTMGDDSGPVDARPQRRVALDAFAMDRYEVTNLQYQRFIQVTHTEPPRYWDGMQYPDGQADFPVVGVGWSQADTYCRWAGKRLPSEAEWEKACRGTDGRIYPWGGQWNPEKANVGLSGTQLWPESLEDGWKLLLTPPGAGKPGLKPVGSYPAGASFYEVLDLSGNASEWVVDWYNWDGYANLPDHNPIGLGPPWNRVLRGSSWFVQRGQESGTEKMSRCATRNSSHTFSDPRVGFRCARSIP